MSPAELPPQACIEIQIQRGAFGFAIGDPVRAGAIGGRIVSFACRGDYRAGAWLVVPHPNYPPGYLVHVPLADLISVR